MPLPRMSDFDKKRQVQTIVRATTPQGGQVEEIDRNVTTVGTGQLSVTSTPQQISLVARNKIATKITNLSATTEIFWGTTSSVSSSTGDLIPAGRGNWIGIPGASVVWVVCASGQTASISWAEAYEA